MNSGGRPSAALALGTSRECGAALRVRPPSLIGGTTEPMTVKGRFPIEKTAVLDKFTTRINVDVLETANCCSAQIGACTAVGVHAVDADCIAEPINRNKAASAVINTTPTDVLSGVSSGVELNAAINAGIRAGAGVTTTAASSKHGDKSEAPHGIGILLTAVGLLVEKHLSRGST